MRRLLGLLSEAAGLMGLLLCVGGMIGCWWLHGDLCERLDRLFDRLDGSLVAINGDVLRARDEIREALRQLNATRQDAAGRTTNSLNPKAGRRPLAGKAMAAVGEQLGEAKPQLVRAVEIGLVVNGLLDALAEFPLVERAGVDTDRLNEASERLSALIGKAQRLAASIDGPADAAADEPSRLSESVGRIVTILDLSAERTDGVRERAAFWRIRVRRVVTAGAWIVTAILAWIGVGQWSLLLHGRARARRALGVRSGIVD